jgi:hypothetical protein
MNSNYRDAIRSGLTSKCQIIEKFLVRYPGSREESINLIFGEKLDRIRVYSKFFSKKSIIDNFDVRAFTFNNKGEDHLEEFGQGITVIIAYSQEIEKFRQLDDQSIVISKQAMTERHSIAYQRHLCDIPNKPSVSLGEYKASKELADTIIRKSNTVFYNIDAIRVQDSFHNESSITGLDIYEACSLARSIGLSNNIKLFCIDIGSEDIHENTVEAVSLLLWYFFEGRTNSSIDTKPENSTTYLVDSEMFDKEVTFWQSKITGRWSFRHPIDNDIYPCTENDYIDLVQGQVPDILLTLT